jgi:hypothetical protein
MPNLNLGDTVQCKPMDWTGVIDGSDNGVLRNAKRYHVTNDSGSMWFYHDELSTLPDDAETLVKIKDWIKELPKKHKALIDAETLEEMKDWIREYML